MNLIRLTKTTFAITITCIVTGCVESKFTKIDIIPLPALTYLDTIQQGSGIRISRFDYYLVTYGRKNEKNVSAYIQTYVDRHFDSSLVKKFGQYNEIFFKTSDSTNLSNIAANGDIIDEYSNQHDLIFEYIWQQGRFLGKFEYKNGVIVNPKHKVTVTDLIEKSH